MNLLFISTDKEKEWNSSEWRCAIPAKAISDYGNGNTAEMIHFNDYATGKAREKILNADIIILQRLALGNAIIQALGIRSLGKTIVLDLDDAYELMPENNPGNSFWNKGIVGRDDKGNKIMASMIPKTELRYGARFFNAITSPSPQILEDWKYDRPTYLVPNYLDLSIYDMPDEDTRMDAAFKIGWAGSHTHIDSFMKSGIMNALKRVYEEQPIKLFLGGGDLILVANIRLPGDAKMYTEWVKRDKYGQVLSAFDIGIAPLSGEYDKRRSWIKVAEYLVMGIPWIASDLGPYDEFRNLGLLVKNTPTDWYNAFIDMLTNYTRYKKEAMARREEMRKWLGIEYHVKDLLDIYERIIQETSREIYIV